MRTRCGTYRHAHAKRDSVYAYKKQLYAWWSSRRFGLEREQSAATVGNNDAWQRGQAAAVDG
jgi:hypothetical protein